MADPTTAQDRTFQIEGSDSQDVPLARMTGRAWIDHLASGAEPSRIRMAKAFFEPNARTVWHRHWRGQIVHVTDGTMILQQRDKAPIALSAGESYACPPGEWHWHGASPTSFMTHIAVIEVDEKGQDADWGDAVTDSVYNIAVEATRTALAE